MKRSPNQDKALAWYCKEHDLRPQISTHPVYYFKNRDGIEEQHNIEHIVMAWEVMRKEKTKKKSRVR